MKIDPRLLSWLLRGMPGAGDLCLHIPSFMVIEAIKKQNGPALDLQKVIAFLVGDLIVQVKEGDPATSDEVRMTWDALMGAMPEPIPMANIVDLPPRKK